MKKTNYFILFLMTALVLSCQDLTSDLEPVFSQDPTPTEAVSENTAKTLFQNWYNTVNAFNGPGLAYITMADAGTCSWGNAAMRDVSSEPRVAFNNADTYSYANVTLRYFNSLYAVLSDANGLLAFIKNGGKLDTPKATECMARFAQGAAVGYVSLTFDRVWINNEDGPINADGAASTPAEGLAFALEQLDKAIQIAENNDFTIGTEYINGVNLTSAQFAKYLNSLAARLMVNMSRNSTQRDATDWTKVLSYANKGIDFDLNVTSDGWEKWAHAWVYYQIYPGWGRTDMRVVNMMDPNTIDYWTSSDGTLAESTSDDARLASDFQYLSNQNFRPGRGLYHFSNYRHSRYDAQAHGGQWNGATPEMLKAENDLYKAEALLRTNDLAGAAAVINAGTRVTRGQLPAVAEDATAISDAIRYEISVELMNSAMGLQFFEMRRNNQLQAGTPLHFPIPGAALLAAGIDGYTFGGTTGTAGEDYSAGGWR